MGRHIGWTHRNNRMPSTNNAEHHHRQENVFILAKNRINELQRGERPDLPMWLNKKWLVNIARRPI